MNLDDPAATAALDQWYVAGSPARETVDQSLQDLRDEGWRVRPHPAVPDSVVVEEVDVRDSTASTAAADVVVCVVDAGIVYEPNAGPGWR